MDDPQQLFVERKPESAAWQLALVLAWATECQLATVEALEYRSRVSKYELRRHRAIAAKLVLNCKDLNVPPKGFMGGPCVRLRSELEKPKEELMAATREADKSLAEQTTHKSQQVERKPTRAENDQRPAGQLR